MNEKKQQNKHKVSLWVYTVWWLTKEINTIYCLTLWWTPDTKGLKAITLVLSDYLLLKKSHGMSLKEKALHLTMRLPSRKIWDGFDMLCKSTYQFPSLKLGTIHVWRPRKLTNFQDLPPPCPAMTKVLALPWPWTSNFKQTHPLSQTITSIMKQQFFPKDHFTLMVEQIHQLCVGRGRGRVQPNTLLP